MNTFDFIYKKITLILPGRGKIALSSIAIVLKNIFYKGYK